MGVFDAWEVEDECMTVEPLNIDLTQPDGLGKLMSRAYTDALHAIDGRYDELVGVNFDELADRMTEDLMQSSVSLPKAAFADWQASGRELLIIKRFYRFYVREGLGIYAAEHVKRVGAFPSGQPQPSKQHKQRLKHS